MNTERKAGTALVIGGGIAGLLAARVLSDLYQEVLVVERDHFPEKPELRPGTPQAYHPHRLLTRGKMILEAFFPGYTDDLLANGAYLRENKRVQFINPYGRLDLTDERDIGSSRMLLEWAIRRRVQQLNNVRFLGRHEVTGLQSTPDQARVTGVHVLERGQTATQRSIAADIVVDTSGHSSKLVKWLSALGYDASPAERLKVNLGYSTRYYKLPPHLADQWSVIFIDADPARGIGAGVLEPVENDITQVVFYCAGGNYYPATDSDNYEREATKLLSTEIAELLPELEALSEPRGYRVPECLRQHFEMMPRWPAGLLVLGDSFCHFDPIFGQGMTVAAIEAEILATCLREQRIDPQPDFERNVLQRMQEAIEPTWWLSVVADLRWPGVDYSGSYSLQGIAFAQKYFDLYLKQIYSHYNMEFFEKYFMMTGLILSPREVINAEMVRAVLAASAPVEAQHLRDEFFGGDDHSVEERLDQLLPSFAQVPVAFPTP